MSETKFTKGPWTMGEADLYSQPGHNCGYEIRSNEQAEFGDTIWIASVHGTHVRTPRNQVANNAALIAAAPELYEALEAMQKSALYHGHGAATATCSECAAVVRARTALAKARGEQSEKEKEKRV